MFILRLTFIICISFVQVRCQSEPEFKPTVSATCNGNTMLIKVRTTTAFYGAVHANRKRRQGCMTDGTGSTETELRLNLADPDGFCGIYIDKNSGQRSVKLAVRVHKTLELADDKIYNVTCESRYRNSRNQSFEASLNFIDDDVKVTSLTFGNPYTLRAVASRPQNFGLNYGIRVSNCKLFGGPDDEQVDMIDTRGCPISDFISKFEYTEGNVAEAKIYKMFKFRNNNKVHVQCDIHVCRDQCIDYFCNGVKDSAQALAIENDNEGTELVSTLAFVLEPGEQPFAAASTECSKGRWAWLLGLTITFGILFLIMFILNILLCILMTCTCTKTEVIEKEPSEIDDYDPYKVGWVPSTGHQSQYGSRYSLNGKPGYTSGASTINSTTRSLSTNSDHYAIVHSRPNSRYSHHSTSRMTPADHHQVKVNGKGPASIVSNGHYSSRI